MEEESWDWMQNVVSNSTYSVNLDEQASDVEITSNDEIGMHDAC